MHDSGAGDTMRKTSSFPASLFFGILAIGFVLAWALLALSRSVGGSLVVLCGAVVAASVAASAIKVAAPWDRAVVLRLGRFRGLRGPGVFAIVPIIDTIPYWIDTRVITT